MDFIKLRLLTELETYQNYRDIEEFFDFIIELKTSNNIELEYLVNLLSTLSGEMNQETLA